MPKEFDRDKVLEALNKYIDDTQDPQLIEFCIDRENPCRDTLNEWSKEDKRFSDTIKRLLAKQELYLSRQLNTPVMAIFRLKQPVFGYTDKQIVDSNVSMQTITVKIGDTN